MPIHAQCEREKGAYVYLLYDLTEKEIKIIEKNK